MAKQSKQYKLEGPFGTLFIDAEDKVTRKLAMLVQGQCLGVSAEEAAQNFGFSRPRYYQVKKLFEEQGNKGLVDSKRGPKQKHVCNETVVGQVRRHRYLDPEASSDVIAQKLRQTGLNVSKRSVERIITEEGLQKKTSTR